MTQRSRTTPATGVVAVNGCALGKRGVAVRLKGGVLGEFGEAGFAGCQGGLFFAEGEADLGGAVARVVVEAGAGDDGDADFLDQILGEADVFGVGGKTDGVGIGEAGDV